MRVLRFAAVRLLLLLPVLLGVTIVTFLLVRVLPGDPVRSILGPSANLEDLEAARQRLGLDQPLLDQYLGYLSGALTGDFGTSIQSGVPVGTEMALRIGPTLELVTVGLILAAILAVVGGLYSALNVNRPSDHAIRLTSLVGNSIPDFWLGLVLILFGYAYLGWFPPPSGRVASSADLTPLTGSGLVDSVLTLNGGALLSVMAHIALPAMTIAVVVCASLLRSVRAAALEIQGGEPWLAARAHGIPRNKLRSRYLYRGTFARLPTLAALVFGNLLGSIVLIEYVFSWQGLGQWTLRGLLFRDYPVVQAGVLVIATVYVLAFLVADVVQAALDPRVQV